MSLFTVNFPKKKRAQYTPWVWTNIFPLIFSRCFLKHRPLSSLRGSYLEVSSFDSESSMISQTVPPGPGNTTRWKPMQNNSTEKGTWNSFDKIAVQIQFRNKRQTSEHGFCGKKTHTKKRCKIKDLER